MIILDTNVVSETLKPAPDPGVLVWLDSRPFRDVSITAVTIAELLYGVACLPPGTRSRALATAVHSLVTEDFAGRVEPFCAQAATDYATIVSTRRHTGRPISVQDAQIAAICHTRGATLATRNTKDFTEIGLELIDPWTTNH